MAAEAALRQERHAENKHRDAESPPHDLEEAQPVSQDDRFFLFCSTIILTSY